MCGPKLGDEKPERTVRAKGLDPRIGGENTSSDKLRKHSFEDLIRFLTF